MLVKTKYSRNENSMRFIKDLRFVNYRRIYDHKSNSNKALNLNNVKCIILWYIVKPFHVAPNHSVGKWTIRMSMHMTTFAT